MKSLYVCYQDASAEEFFSIVFRNNKLVQQIDIRFQNYIDRLYSRRSYDLPEDQEQLKEISFVARSTWVLCWLEGGDYEGADYLTDKLLQLSSMLVEETALSFVFVVFHCKRKEDVMSFESEEFLSFITDLTRDEPCVVKEVFIPCEESREELRGFFDTLIG